MDCNKFREYIGSYVDNDITPDLKVSMDSHAKSCPSCKKELDNMHYIVDCMNSMSAIPVPDDFLSKLNKRIDSEGLILGAKTVPSYKKIFNYKTYSAVAACVLLFVMFKADIPGMMSQMNSDGTEQQIRSVITDTDNSARIGGAEETAKEAQIPEVVSQTEEIAEPVEDLAAVPVETETAVGVTPAPVQNNIVNNTKNKTVTTKKATQKTVQPKSVVAPVATPAPAQGSNAVNTTASVASVDSADGIEALSETEIATNNNRVASGGGSAAAPLSEAAAFSVSAGGGGGSTGGGTSVATDVTAYNITITTSDINTVTSVLYAVGCTKAANGYTISAAGTPTLLATLNANNISYTKSQSATDNTKIYITVKRK